MFSLLFSDRSTAPVTLASRVCLVGLFLLLGTGPVAAQDLVVNDGTQESFPNSNCNSSPDYNTIQDGVDNASAGQTILVCPGTYGETVNVKTSLTINGPYNGTPGYDVSRNTDEAVVDAGTSSPVDQTSNIAFTIQAEDVTIDGFKLIGNQGVVLDPDGVSNSPTNDGSGLTVQNNLVATDIVGVAVRNVTTTSSKSFTIADNQFELGRQSFELSSDGDGTEGSKVSEYTASVGIRNIDGDQAPTIQDNVVTDDGNSASPDGDDDGSFYGYAIDGLKVSSGPTTIAGDPGGAGNTGTIQGTAQGIAVLDGQSARQSNVAIEDFSISAMSGSAPNNGRVNFQAGIYTYTATGDNNGTTDVVIANTTVEGLDFSDPKNAGDVSDANASANIYLSAFDFGSNTVDHNVTIKGVTVQNTEHRGISLAGTASSGSGADDIDAEIKNNTVVKGVAAGNDAHAIHSENGGSPTIKNTTITNVNTSGAQGIHVRQANEPATVTIGTGVTINSNGQATFGSQGAPGSNGTATINGDVTIDQFQFGTTNADLSLASGANVTLTGTSTLSDLSDDQSNVTLDPAATIRLDGGTYNLNANTRIPSILEFANSGSVESSASENLIVDNTSLGGTGSIQRLDVQNGSTLSSGANVTLTGLLTLSSGTFDVSSGTLTLASSGNASTAFVSGSGSGTITGSVTVEWEVPSFYTGWQALTAPVDAPFDGTADALLSNMWTQKSGSGTGYDAANGDISNSSVFDYDEGAFLDGDALKTAWFAPSDISTAITQGQTGRLVYFFKDRDFDGNNDESSTFTLSATGALLDKENNKDNTDVDLGLAFTDDSDDDSANGWNLVGNPFMAPIDWELMTDDGNGRNNVEQTVYIPTADGNYATYQADGSGTSGSNTNGGTRYISPFQGFFVKATGATPSLDLKSSDKALNQSPTLKRNGASAPEVKLRMQAENSSRDEETVVRFSDGATVDASDGDAYQLVPFSNDYFYVASEIPDSSSAYEIQSLPLPNTGKRTVPLELASAMARTYTLGGTLQDVPSDWTVRLKDRRSGATADLTRGESLTVGLEGNDKSAAAAGSKAASSPPRLRQPLVASASGTAPGAPNKAAADSARVVLEATRSGALPVELAEFEGQVREGTIELAWTTASESNNAGFRIQRSPSGSAPWAPLGFIEGEGTTSSPEAYRFTDDDLPYEGDSFAYRLKQVDTDGTVRYSDPITVERGAPSAFRVQSVFPNPARSKVTVRYEVPDKTTVTIALYDVLGRRVSTALDRSQTAGRKQITVPVSSLSNGVHFLRLRTESAVETRKLVVVE